MAYPAGHLIIGEIHTSIGFRNERPRAFMDMEKSHIKPRILAKLEDPQIESLRHHVARAIRGALRREHIREVVCYCL